jgi:hypothetical protein
VTWHRQLDQQGKRLRVSGGVFQFDFYTDSYNPIRREIAAWMGHTPSDRNLWHEDLTPPDHLRPAQWLEEIARQWPAWLETYPELEVLMMEAIL